MIKTEKNKKLKVDLHVHSRFSNQPSQWILRKMGFSESYTDPFQIYGVSKKNGMDLITIADHDTIDGVLSIAHLPDTFISEEITTFFPEDSCKIHVLAFNINEAQHLEIQKVRPNVYELVDYLISANIAHSLAHPIYSSNNRLSVTTFEKMLLLFKNLELNGARSDIPNRALRLIVAHLEKSHIDAMANRHGFYPKYDEPWKKGITGGSDDHSGLNINRTYTLFDGKKNVESLINSLNNQQTDVVNLPPNPRTFALNLYGIGWQYYKQKLNLEDFIDKDILLTFIERVLQLEPKLGTGMWSKIYNIYAKVNAKRSAKKLKTSVHGSLLKQAHKVVQAEPLFKKIACKDKVDEFDREQVLFDFAKSMSNSMICDLSASVLGNQPHKMNFLHLFQGITSAGSLHTLMTPYFVSYKLFARDRVFSNNILEHIFKDERLPEGLPLNTCLNIAQFTDTISDINGVALTLKQRLNLALKSKKSLNLICCEENQEEADGVKCFTPLTTFKIPEYNIQSINIPPFLEMLDYCYQKGFTQIHVDTPGPVGLAGLGIARLLDLPCYGTYHTAFPQYARDLTADPILESAVWQYMVWFYNMMDAIFVPSQSTADDIIAQGVKKEKIIITKRGIDITKFNPSKRNGYLQKKHHIKSGVNFLYVGRVSKEKNLEILKDAFIQLSKIRNDANLIIVGDGPYLETLREELNGTNSFFTGFLEGDDLSAVYASSDVFVFPSTTDTFGYVILEAQASGLPVIVTDQGGPKESIIPNVTGLIVEGKNVNDLLAAMIILLDDGDMRKQMGKSGRENTEKQTFESTFNQTWEIYSDLYSPFGC
jgi:glycosyltransferase involved in cell wall biosynthesis